MAAVVSFSYVSAVFNNNSSTPIYTYFDTYVYSNSANAYTYPNFTNTYTNNYVDPQAHIYPFADVNPRVSINDESNNYCAIYSYRYASFNVSVNECSFNACCNFYIW